MSEPKSAPNFSDRTRVMRYRQTSALLDKWLADDSDYDAQVWKHLQADLRRSPMQSAASRASIESDHGLANEEGVS